MEVDTDVATPAPTKELRLKSDVIGDKPTPPSYPPSGLGFFARFLLIIRLNIVGSHLFATGF